MLRDRSTLLTAHIKQRMDSTARIRELNDAFRTGFDRPVYVTAGIAAMSPEQQVEVMRRGHCFIAFTPHSPDNALSFGGTCAIQISAIALTLTATGAYALKPIRDISK